MMIPGWEDEPLVDGTPLLAERAFWTAYLGSTMGIEEIEPFAESFAIDIDAAEEWSERLWDPEQWPVFRVPLRSGALLDVVHRNMEDDPGVDYVLTAPGLPGGSLTLAAVEGAFSGPGLSWQELRTAAADPVAVAQAGAHAGAHAGAGTGAAAMPYPPGVVTDPAARLLLLLPATGETDPDLPDDAISLIAGALGRVGAAKDAEKLAHTLLYGRESVWEPVHWTYRADGALCCDGGHSRRGLAPAAFSPAEALAVTRALAAG